MPSKEKIEITREALSAIIENAFEAGGAFTIGSHMHFNQVHPDRITYREKVIKELMEN